MAPWRGARGCGCHRAEKAGRGIVVLLAVLAAAVDASSLRRLRQTHVGQLKPTLVSGPPLVVDSRNATGAAGSLGMEKVMNSEVKPQVFFLFMAYSSINHMSIWERFFDGGDRGVDYTVLVHCVNEAACRKNLEAYPRFLVIPSVRTSYCHDLVSGMNALLKSALVVGGIGSPFDKFVFISDSTLPVKPLSFVREQLTGDQSSDFCIFPRNEWAEVHEANSSSVRIAPKTHQWMVLSRKHAELSVEKSGQNLDLMKQLQLNMQHGSSKYTNTGCLDEFWHFATIYNSLQIKPGNEVLPVEDFNGGPLSTGSFEIQGRCDTFVQWVRRASGMTNNMTHLAQAMTVDAGTDLAPATQARPGSIHRFGRASLKALRKSAFLFVRKVSHTAAFSGCESLSEAFSALVFQDGREDAAPQAWDGAGIWLDNQRSRVSINSFEGAIRLAGEHPDMQAKGFYCGKRMEVAFSSGYKSSAVLSEDGKSLHWANGVTWPRLEHGP